MKKTTDQKNESNYKSPTIMSEDRDQMVVSMFCDQMGNNPQVPQYIIKEASMRTSNDFNGCRLVSVCPAIGRIVDVTGESYAGAAGQN